MAPTLTPGDYLIITEARTVRPGFVVLVDHPKFGTIIKRVTSVADAFVRLEGDGADSTSADALGEIALKLVKGRARLAITPKGLKRL